MVKLSYPLSAQDTLTRGPGEKNNRQQKQRIVNLGLR